jgi:hypothetical protein
MFIILISLYAFLATAKPEESEAIRAVRLGCEKQRLGRGCVNYANFLLKNGDEKKAKVYFQKGCKLKVQDGCDQKRWETKPKKVATTEIKTEAFSENGKEMVTLTSTSKDDGMEMSVTDTMPKEVYESMKEKSKIIYKAIGSCDETFKLEIPHPMIQDFIIQQKIQKSGENCIYSQTMPNNGNMTCTFNKAQSKEIEGGDENTFGKLMSDESVCKITGY